jgi:hypothetical protein
VAAIWLVWFAEVLANAVLPPLLALQKGVLYNQVAPYLVFAAVLGATAPLAAFWPWNRIPRGRRAIAFFCMAWGCADSLRFITFELKFVGVFNSVTEQTALEYINILRAATALCSILALLVIFFREQRRIAQDRALLAGEMASAREIQQYLIPDKLPATPGLSINTIYQPSREVGGDFFQVLPDLRDGSTLIVVGDVAGKGLQAAMLAALIIGAIRVAFKFTSDPGRILTLLNERLQGRGLVTCLAIRIRPDGTAEMANAGHLPPYIDGKEFEMEGALPLGALPDISFPTTPVRLGQGQSMLFVSDGVVEARSADGELFGFERIGEMATLSAADIAYNAQCFGQEDDITVLTLALAPQGALAV